ncbi:SOS response-associated peptidase [Flavivirga sp. 57AJ16]|uniref:SOS response-associated peptidase n=1 Tax=Flavivirga sp. 57AJ16 TaxID=3025307 RepID=UPI002365E25F|nr:SOS response-associated peptidase family protein [Flavivirga sp. 57AJ16]MDD7885433.1 SOS response-associated peptidase family protein [Flavivirga sp. 57AJ16]
MCYKISNTASVNTIEKAFNVSFRFPKIHKSNPIIDGMKESTVSLITMNKPKEVSPAIWGILPESFQNEWQYFQNVKNTLNLKINDLNEDPKYQEAIKNRRCLIIATGFFTYYLYDGDLYPYYVHLKSEEPFVMAGIYNQLDDGFKTCSMIVSKANSYIQKIHNSDMLMPVVLDKLQQEKWLGIKTNTQSIALILDTVSQLEFNAYPIAKEFHKRDVVYDSILEPVFYSDIPKPN